MANAQIAQQVIGEQLLKAAQVAEEQVDKEIHRLETLDDDDLERLRQKRVEHMKQAQKQRNVCRILDSKMLLIILYLI